MNHEAPNKGVPGVHDPSTFPNIAAQFIGGQTEADLARLLLQSVFFLHGQSVDDPSALRALSGESPTVEHCLDADSSQMARRLMRDAFPKPRDGDATASERALSCMVVGVPLTLTFLKLAGNDDEEVSVRLQSVDDGLAKIAESFNDDECFEVRFGLSDPIVADLERETGKQRLIIRSPFHELPPPPARPLLKSFDLILVLVVLICFGAIIAKWII